MSAPPRPTRAETFLILRAQMGDRDALDQLFAWCDPIIRPHVRQILRDAAAAEDVLQDVFFAIYRKIGYLRDPELFRPWLFRIATREALRHRRRATGRCEDPLEDAASADAPERRLNTSLLSRQALEKLQDVSPISRAILSLHYLEEMTIEEAAEVLDIPIGTAKSRLARAIKALRGKFNL